MKSKDERFRELTFENEEIDKLRYILECAMEELDGDVYHSALSFIKEIWDDIELLTDN